MLDRDKLHIVLYVNVADIDDEDIPAYIEEIAKAFEDKDGSTVSYFIPIRGERETMVEFHWPPCIPEDERKLPDNIIDWIEKEKFINYNVN